MYSKYFLFTGYSRRISNYLERIILFDLNHMMRMTDLVAICGDTGGHMMRMADIVAPITTKGRANLCRVGATHLYPTKSTSTG